eukprot:6198921-Pleurochrysis_carterae.AAC.2
MAGGHTRRAELILLCSRCLRTQECKRPSVRAHPSATPCCARAFASRVERALPRVALRPRAEACCARPSSTLAQPSQPSVEHTPWLPLPENCLNSAFARVQVSAAT